MAIRHLRTELLLLVLCSACGHDEDVERSGLPRGAIVRELPEEDVTKLCRWMVPRMREGAGASARCTASAVREATNQAECVAQRDRCVADSDEPSLEAELAACDAIANSIFHEDCDAPVGIIEDCLLEVISITRETNLSCERFSEQHRAQERRAESCRPLWSECFP